MDTATFGRGGRAAPPEGALGPLVLRALNQHMTASAIRDSGVTLRDVADALQVSRGAVSQAMSGAAWWQLDDLIQIEARWPDFARLITATTTMPKWLVDGCRWEGPGHTLGRYSPPGRDISAQAVVEALELLTSGTPHLLSDAHLTVAVTKEALRVAGTPEIVSVAASSPAVYVAANPPLAFWCRTLSDIDNRDPRARRARFRVLFDAVLEVVRLEGGALIAMAISRSANATIERVLTQREDSQALELRPQEFARTDFNAVAIETEVTVQAAAAAEHFDVRMLSIDKLTDRHA